MVRCNGNVFVTKDLLTDVARVTRLSVIWGTLGVIGFIPTLVGISQFYPQTYGMVSKELYWVLFAVVVWVALGVFMEMLKCLAETKAMVGRDDVTLDEGEFAERSLGGMQFSIGGFLFLGLVLLGMQLFRIGLSEVHLGFYIMVGIELFALLTSFLLASWGVWALEAIALSTREELARKGIDVPPRITWRDVKLPSC
jgi:hypothetical protein